MWKKKVSILLTAAMVLAAQPEGISVQAAQGRVQKEQTSQKTASEEEDLNLQDVAATKFYNGSEGNFSWEFTAADGVLTIKGLKSISGSSVMAEYTKDNYQTAPWYCQETGYGKGIRKIVFSGTIQSLGSYSFYSYPNIEEVDFSSAADLASLGKYAFNSCGASGGMRVIGADSITTLGEACFQGSSVTDITLPAVTVLPTRCFYQCKSLTSATLSKLKTMGTECFAYCTSLIKTPDLSGYTGTTLPVGSFRGDSALSSAPGLGQNTVITELGDYCFASTALESVSLPANTKTLGQYAFERCPLESLPEGFSSSKLTTVKSYCFSGVSSLTEIVIPANITTLGGSVFYNCKSVKRAEIAAGSNLTSIPEYTFSNCWSLEEIIFPENVKITTIARDALSNCTSLASLELPDTVVSIGYDAFFGDKNLEKISFTAGSLTELDWSAFNNCDNLHQILFYGSSVPMSSVSFTSGVNPDIYVSTEDLQTSLREKLSSQTSYKEDAAKPEALQKIRVLTEADKSRKSARLSVALEENRLTQEELQSGEKFEPEIVTNTSEQKSIQYYYYTDSNCTQLYDEQNPANVPDRVGIYYIRGYGAETDTYFRTWSNILSCRVDGLLEEDTYTYDTIQKVLTILDTADNLGTQTDEESGESNFQSRNDQPWSLYRGEIESVVWDSKVQETRIGDYMFEDFSSLKEIEFPEGIVKIGKSAFLGCKSFTSLVIPEGVTVIDDKAFSSSAIGTITLPDSLETIGNSAFQAMNLKSVLCIPASVTTLGESAFQNTVADNIQFSEQVGFTEIPGSCFQALSLKECELFEIPEGVQTLGEKAFYDAKLTNILVPESVTNIKASAFQGCTKLKRIYLLNEEYTSDQIERVDLVVGSRTCDSIFAGTAEDLMIICEGDTYQLLKDVPTYNYGSQLYNTSTIKGLFDETKNDCSIMEKADYPEEAWEAFEAVFTKAVQQAEAEKETLFETVNNILQSEQDIIDAAGVLLLASLEDAGKVTGEGYTESSWDDFYSTYVDFQHYFELYGTVLVRGDISYLAELNAEMAQYRRQLMAKSDVTPAPGQTETPGQTEVPGQTETPGQTDAPAPGNTAAPGQTETPKQPDDAGKATVKLKKPVWKKAVSTKKKTVSLQWKKTAGAGGYQIAYSYKKSMKNAKKVNINKVGTTTRKISGLKRKKTCYIRIRAWIKTDGKKVYSSWSTVKKVKVK